MKILIDTNIIIAAIIKKNSLIRKMLVKGNMEGYFLMFSLNEILKHKNYIINKAKITEEEFIVNLNLLLKNLVLLEDNTFNSTLDYSIGIMYKIDLDDSFILAAAFAIDADFIWSDDRHFKQQNVAKVLNTDEMVRFL